MAISGPQSPIYSLITPLNIKLDQGAGCLTKQEFMTESLRGY